MFDVRVYEYLRRIIRLSRPAWRIKFTVYRVHRRKSIWKIQTRETRVTRGRSNVRP